MNQPLRARSRRKRSKRIRGRHNSRLGRRSTAVSSPRRSISGKPRGAFSPKARGRQAEDHSERLLEDIRSSGIEAGQQAIREHIQNNGQRDCPVREHFRKSLAASFHAAFGAALPEFVIAMAYGMAFREGYLSSFEGSPPDLGVPVPLSGEVSVVITACNEGKTIGTLLYELERLFVKEKIVVLNGCTDNSFSLIKERKDIILAYYPDRLGHDVGRAVGAKLSTGEAVLFVDGDMKVPAEELAAFLYEQEKGLDVVLNDISPYLPVFARQDEVSRCKLFLNQALGRSDLKSNSMTAIPHVLSRRAIQTIGTANLAVPPKAQAIAILEGLLVAAPCTADVIGRNRVREGNVGAGNSVLLLILGDHMEAVGEAIRRRGPRLLWQTESRASLAKERNRR